MGRKKRKSMKKRKNKGGKNMSYLGSPYGSTAQPAYSAKPTLTVHKMDKSFDFSDVVKKYNDAEVVAEMSATNTINDEKFKRGILKTIIMAGNGVFEATPSKYGFSLRNYTQGYSGLGEIYASLKDGLFITHNPYEKLPKMAIDHVIAWYKRITEKNGQEAQINFYYNEFDVQTIKDSDDVEHNLKDVPGIHFWSDKLFSYVPLQHNSSALTEVASQDKFYDELNRVFGMYIETHSHNSMDAFASGTDEANSKNDGHQLVFGKLNTDNPVMYSWSTANLIFKGGLSVEDLQHLINVKASYDPNTSHVIYDVNDLGEIDSTLLDAWDKQVVERPVRTYTYSPTNVYTNYWNQTAYQSSVDDYYDWEKDYPSSYSTYRKPATTPAYTRSKYTPYTQQEELEVVSEIINNQLRFYESGQNSFFDNHTVADAIRLAYIAGITRKRMSPTMNDSNVETISAHISDDIMDVAFNIFDQAFHDEEPVHPAYYYEDELYDEEDDFAVKS